MVAPTTAIFVSSEVCMDAYGNLMPVWSGVSVLVGLAFLILFAGSLIWLYQDAESRGKAGCLWMLIAWFTWPFGVLAYILLRDQDVRL